LTASKVYQLHQLPNFEHLHKELHWVPLPKAVVVVAKVVVAEVVVVPARQAPVARLFRLHVFETPMQNLHLRARESWRAREHCLPGNLSPLAS
jgi:hypothetical protein